MTDFEFIEMSPGTVELGWRFDSVLPKKVAETLSELDFGAGHVAAVAAGRLDRHGGPHDFRTLFFSPRRTVSCPVQNSDYCGAVGDLIYLRRLRACRKLARGMQSIRITTRPVWLE